MTINLTRQFRCLYLKFFIASHSNSINFTVNQDQKFVMYECDSTFDCGGWADRVKGSTDENSLQNFFNLN